MYSSSLVSTKQYHQTWKESWKPEKCGFTEECYTYLGTWKDHVTNDEVLRRGRTERKLMNRIRAGQMSFLGHITRKHRRENIVVTGKIEGERSRGRPRLNFMKSLSQLLKISEVEIIETRSREEWRTMTANVRTGYGT